MSKITHEDKIDFMIQVAKDIQDAIVALSYTTETKHGTRYSDTFDFVSSMNIYDKLENTIRDESSRAKYPNLNRVDPEYQFSDDPKNFLGDLVYVAMFFAGKKGKDPKADFLAMRALFEAGRVIKRLKFAGLRRSDTPVKAGSSPWKNKVGHQKVFNEYYYMNTAGMKKWTIAKKIEENLRRKEEKGGKNAKSVYTPKTILKILKPELEKLGK